MGFRDCFTLDLMARQPRSYGFRELLRRLIYEPGYRVVVYYRLSQWFLCLRWLGHLGKMASQLILVRISRVPGVEIRTPVPIGEGLLIYHPHDVVIGSGARVGRNATIYNGVTLGARTRIALDENKDVSSRYPTLEDDVTVFPGAKLVGPIVIGKGSIVAANAVVTESFPPGSIIGGIPARLLKSLDPEET